MRSARVSNCSRVVAPRFDDELRKHDVESVRLERQSLCRRDSHIGARHGCARRLIRTAPRGPASVCRQAGTVSANMASGVALKLERAAKMTL